MIFNLFLLSNKSLVVRFAYVFVLLFFQLLMITNADCAPWVAQILDVSVVGLASSVARTCGTEVARLAMSIA